MRAMIAFFSEISHDLAHLGDATIAVRPTLHRINLLLTWIYVDRAKASRLDRCNGSLERLIMGLYLTFQDWCPRRSWSAGLGLLLAIATSACSRSPQFDPAKCYSVNRVRAILSGQTIDTNGLGPSTAKVTFDAVRDTDVIDVPWAFKPTHPTTLAQCQTGSAVPLEVTKLFFSLSSAFFPGGRPKVAHVTLLATPFKEVSDKPIGSRAASWSYSLPIHRQRFASGSSVQQVNVRCDAIVGIGGPAPEAKDCSATYLISGSVFGLVHFWQADISSDAVKASLQRIAATTDNLIDKGADQ